MVSRRKPKKPPSLPRLVRFIRKGQTLAFTNARGKRVKHPKAGRSYIISIQEHRKTVAYVSNVKRGKPVARTYTRSMLSRLRYTRHVKIREAPKPGKCKQKLTNRKYLKDQISEKLIREIRQNRGKAFAIRIKHKYSKVGMLGNAIYIKKRLKSEYIKNIIVSEFLRVMGGAKFKLSPKLKTIDPKGIRRLTKAELSVDFVKIRYGMDLRGNKNGKTKRKNKKRS